MQIHRQQSRLIGIIRNYGEMKPKRGESYADLIKQNFKAGLKEQLLILKKCIPTTENII